MKRAARHEKDVEMDIDAGGELLVPGILLQIQVPKIPRQDTSKFQDWHWRDANKRKAVHIRCNVEEVGRVQSLLEVAKDKKWWKLCGARTRGSAKWFPHKAVRGEAKQQRRSAPNSECQ